MYCSASFQYIQSVDDPNSHLISVIGSDYDLSVVYNEPHLTDPPCRSCLEISGDT
jgi:hypothetical protein